MPNPRAASDFARRFARWRTRYLSEARQDGHRIFVSHLDRLGLQCGPHIDDAWQTEVVAACLALWETDVDSRNQFLRRQRYAPTARDGSRYVVTLGHLGSAFARLVVRDDLKDIDFADLLGMPWDSLESVGYDQVWISRIDGAGLDLQEAARLQQAVEADLWFDYGEEELQLYCEFDEDHGVFRLDVMEL